VPNTKSAAKAMRQAERRRAINKPIRTRARNAVKVARLTIEANPDEAQKAVVAAVSALDRAAAKGVIHKNAAARRKSRLMRRLNNAQRPAAAPVETKTTRGRSAASQKASRTGQTKRR
jgi:small subunit ribosomal protein S20